MQKLIELQKDETILVSSKIEQYLQPDFIYLPVKDGVLNIHKNDKVSIGSVVLPQIFSPVSGYVRRLVKRDSLINSEYYLEIENDFQETRLQESFLQKRLKKENILSMLDLDNKKKLVLNALDNELYVLTENFYLFLYYEELLDLLDEISQMFDITIYVCLKASSSANINKLMSALGMYPTIILKVLPDYYLLAKDHFLLSYLELDEEETQVVRASKLYEIYNKLKKNKITTSKLITISGNAIKPRMIVDVKIGTRLKEVIDEFFLVNENALFIANGLMSGKEINLDEFIITDELNSVLVMSIKEEKKEGKCINCGLCSELCPVKIKPVFLKDPKYFNLVKDKCINCGLCSYICPVYINFNRYLKGEYHE